MEDCENKWRLMSCETERIFYCIGTTSHESVYVCGTKFMLYVLMTHKLYLQFSRRGIFSSLGNFFDIKMLSKDLLRCAWLTSLENTFFCTNCRPYKWHLMRYWLIEVIKMQARWKSGNK